MLNMILEIDGIPIHITRKSIKNLTLRVYPPDGTVKVSAPLKMRDQLIHHYLHQQKIWIHSQRERILNRPQTTVESYQTGSFIDYLGKKYLLILIEHNGPSRIKISDEYIYCYSKPDCSEEKIKQFFDKWYRCEMTALLPQLIKQWENIIGVQITEWGIKKMKTRWGSCNTRARRIWLNLNLMKKPVSCLEYVLVHELIHLLEASHNHRFYAFMTQFLPHWRECERMLK